MGVGEVGGGFFTGWKGIAVGLASVAAVGGLAATGYIGSTNNTVILGIASSEFIGQETDFGEILYNQCRVNGTYDDGNWEHTFPDVPDGNQGTADLDTIALSNLEALRKLGDVFPGNATDPASYRQRPESACFSVCRKQFGDKCTMFTYDGITDDSCRFVSPGKTPPPLREVDTDSEGDHFYIFNGTCMQEVRANFLAVIDQPRTNLTRPVNNNTEGGPADESEWSIRYFDAMEKSLTFLRAQWAGTLEEDYNTTKGVEWRRPGFVNKAAGCPENLGGNFATGDHIQSTLATAEQVGVMSLARMWWQESFTVESASTVDPVFITEIGRQSLYLTNTWDGAAEEMLVGVGDQLSGGNLLMYKDFGTADRALQVGENTDNPNGQPLTEAPECTYTTPEAPAADVAAHTAAALALSSQVVNSFLTTSEGTATPADMLATAEALYAYAKDKAPLKGVLTTNATDAGKVKKLGVSQIYPNNQDSYVRSHQLWAACTLLQATGKQSYWDDAEAIYTTFIRREVKQGQTPPKQFEPYQLYDPVANYFNPVWWGMLCMAQSAPEYTGLEEEANLVVPRQVSGGAASDEKFLAFLLDQEFKRGTRGEATQQIWEQFVLPWITYDGANKAIDRRITASPGDAFRYFDINGPANDSLIVPDSPPGVQGVFRDSAGAAVVALMYADLPGVAEDNSFWARCMAVQTVNFMLGENSDEFSYMVGFGGTSPKNPYHKDAACPSEEVRALQFQPVFNKKTRAVNVEVNSTLSDEFSTRLCDFLTFQGDPAEADKARPPDDSGNLFYDVGDPINPVLDNPFNLTGALVSSFLPVGETNYIDERFVCPDGTSYRNELRSVPADAKNKDDSERCGGEKTVANPLSQVSVDSNGALTAALAGIANLPPSFFAKECPAPSELAELALESFNDARQAPSVQIEDVNPRVESGDAAEP